MARRYTARSAPPQYVIKCSAKQETVRWVLTAASKADSGAADGPWALPCETNKDPPLELVPFSCFSSSLGTHTPLSGDSKERQRTWFTTRTVQTRSFMNQWKQPKESETDYGARSSRVRDRWTETENLITVTHWHSVKEKSSKPKALSITDNISFTFSSLRFGNLSTFWFYPRKGWRARKDLTWLLKGERAAFEP